jgi:deazaflavin-dependent oxidoreductase (nitroreductase family)
MSEAVMSEAAFKMPDWMSDHIALYQRDPEKAHMWDSALGGNKGGGKIPTLLLSTKGRKSGKTSLTPLIYSKQGNGFAVIASKGGAPNHPAWYLNLSDNPEVEIQVGPTHYKARARTAEPAARKKIWADMVKLYPPYDEYQARAGREIPVVILEPKA